MSLAPTKVRKNMAMAKVIAMTIVRANMAPVVIMLNVKAMVKHPGRYRSVR